MMSVPLQDRGRPWRRASPAFPPAPACFLPLQRPPPVVVPQLVLADDRAAVIEAAVARCRGAAAQRCRAGVDVAAAAPAAVAAADQVDAAPPRPATPPIAACHGGGGGGGAATVASIAAAVEGAAGAVAASPAVAAGAAGGGVPVRGPPLATVALQLGTPGRLAAAVYGALPRAAAATFAELAVGAGGGRRRQLRRWWRRRRRAAGRARPPFAPTAGCLARPSSPPLSPSRPARALSASHGCPRGSPPSARSWRRATRRLRGCAPRPRRWRRSRWRRRLAGRPPPPLPPRMSTGGSPPPPAPWTAAVYSAVVARLLPYQLTAIAAGVACGGRLRLADVVGTGKIAIALALASVYHRPETPTHIIVPASLGVPQARALRM